MNLLSSTKRIDFKETPLLFYQHSNDQSLRE